MYSNDDMKKQNKKDDLQVLKNPTFLVATQKHLVRTKNYLAAELASTLFGECLCVIR